MTRFIVIMGPPGVGKGTQADLLAPTLSVPHIVTSDLLRREIARETLLGRSLTDSMSRGEYVSDATTSELLRVRISQPDAQEGFVLDGFPRTHTQVDALDSMLRDRQEALDAVVLLEADDAALLDRLSRRSAGGRVDDRSDTAARRLEVYRASTAPIAERYAERVLLHRIDASGSREQVASAISDLILATRGDALEEPDFAEFARSLP